MTIAEISIKSAPLFREFGIKRAAVFGSRARGEERVDSDVDLLVEFFEPLGLFRFAELNYRLEDALQSRVDLVKHKALKPGFAETVLQDAKYIYG